MPDISGNRLKEARLARGMTQRELAKQTGISQKTIWYLETHGTDRGRCSTMDALLKSLGLESRELTKTVAEQQKTK